jgi:cyclopropane-fatty-acyl-phospholipid synthase
MTTADQLRRHYDQPPELFALFLDREFMAYSAGRWQPGDALEQAQARNLRAIASALAMTPRSAILDVGCGWGALAKHCARTIGTERYVGLTPSPVQIAHVAGCLGGKGELHETLWQDYASAPGRFDAVAALESIEHFGAPGGRRTGRAIEEYRRFFAFSAACSTPSAKLYVQTSAARRMPRTRGELVDVRFLLEDVFYGSRLADIGLIEEASAGIYAADDLSWGAEDYLATLRAWHERLVRESEVCIKTFGSESYAFFDRYFSSCIRLFEGGVVDLLRAVYVKRPA